MFIVANFIIAFAKVLEILLTFYMWVIIARAVISWVNADPYNPVVQFLYKVTEPVLYPIRRMLGTYAIGIDLSPMLMMLVIIFLRSFLIRSLLQLAERLR